MDGFFSSDAFTPTKVGIPLRANCDACGLFRTCKTPKMPVDGEGRKGILIVSERPGQDEDSEGRPFVGPTGRDLNSTLRKYGIEVRRDCWLYNAVICKPPESTPANAVDHCRPNLIRTIKELNPSTIILLGHDAVRSLIGWLWKPKVGPIERWVGWKIPARQINCWVTPTYQPASFFYHDRDKSKEDKDPVKRMDYERHLTEAVQLEGRPWPDGPPDYEKEIECIHSASEAAERVKKYTGGTIAFDYETNCLKPDSREGQLVSCSICWEGQETISFPWYGPVIPAMKHLLSDPNVSKIGWNAKMEDRWTRAKLGTQIEGWVWDGMLAAHMLDPRGGKEGGERKDQSGITGLKFQSFCLLGMPDYSSSMDPYLHSSEKGGYNLNRIRDADRGKLLLYGGYDSLLTFKIAQIQMERLRRANTDRS